MQGYLLHFLQSVAFVSAHFSSLYLHLYSSFDSVNLCYYFCFQHIWLICFFVSDLLKRMPLEPCALVFYWAQRFPPGHLGYPALCPLVLFSLHCCINISSALFLFLFASKGLGPLPHRSVEFVWKPLYSLSWTMKWHMSLCVAIDSHILQLVFSMAWPTSAKLRPETHKPLKTGTMWNFQASHHSHQLMISFALQISCNNSNVL